MEDKQIVQLYWDRSQQAVEETSKKYGRYCYSIAYNILGNVSDAEESLNDTYLDAWNSMPPHRPSVLSTFLGKITRRVSIDRFRYLHAEKRGNGELPLVIDELETCISAGSSVEGEIELQELTHLLERFLDGLSGTERRVFVCRYWYMDSVASICVQFGFSQSKVKTMLYRTREKLKKYLEQEGYLV